MAWSTHFVDPVPLPDGGKLKTLQACAEYIIALPGRKPDRPEWQLAMQALMLCAEGGSGGEPMLARIAMMKALYPKGDPAVLALQKRRARAYRIIR
jgi:hypothetical protein